MCIPIKLKHDFEYMKWFTLSEKNRYFFYEMYIFYNFTYF